MPKISQYPNLPVPDSADLINVVDVSAGESKRSTVAQVAGALAATSGFTSVFAPINNPTFTGNVVVPNADAPTEAMNQITADGRYAPLPGKPFAAGSAYGAEGVTRTDLQTPTTNLLGVSPIMLGPGVWDALVFNVVTAAASSTFVAVLYEMAASGLPGNLVGQSGEIDTSITGEKEYAFSSALVLTRPAWFFVGGVAHVDRPTLAGGNPSNSIVPAGSDERPAAGYVKGSISGAAPASWGSFSGVSPNLSNVLVRRSA